MKSRFAIVGFSTLGVALALAGVALALANIANLTSYPNPYGRLETFTSAGSIDTSGAFFRPNNSAGTTCVMCHEPGDGWSLSAQNVRERFRTAEHKDTLFLTEDGTTCPTDNISTHAGRQDAYRLVLTKGLIRLHRAIPPNAEFEVIGLNDPYGCSTTTQLSVYRRPPSVVLRFDTTLPPPSTVADKFGPELAAFMFSLDTAQTVSKYAGRLDEDGAHGGPVYLSKQQFSYGVNDPFGWNFNPTVFTLFESWGESSRHRTEEHSEARESIARGEAIFNTRPMRIEGVAGLNDVAAAPVIFGTCTTCHNTPNVGNHSVFAPMNTGIDDGSRRTPDLPLFILRNNSTGETLSTSDPGRATVTGKWTDIGKTNVPVLRGLAARAPYFHNGSATSIFDVVNFYDRRFNLGLSEQEKHDLTTFLSSL